MNTHLIRQSLQKPTERKLRFYDVTHITQPQNCPLFGSVVRGFSSRRKLSLSEHQAFLLAFDRDYYLEVGSGRHDYSDFRKWEHTLRHARKVFWKLIAYEESALAKKILAVSFKFLESCRWIIRDREDGLARVDAVYDQVVLFMLERYLQNDVEHGFFSPRMFKLLFVRAAEAKSDVSEKVYVSVLEKMLKKYKENLTLGIQSIGEEEWLCLQQVFFSLVEDVGKNSLSKAVRSLIGQLLVVLERMEFDHSNIRINGGKRSMALHAYQVSVRSVLTDIRVWLDGKQLERQPKIPA